MRPRPPCSFGQPTPVQPCSARCRFQASRSSIASCSLPGPPSPLSVGELAGQVLLEPRPDLGAEGLVLGGVAQVHVWYSTKQMLGLETAACPAPRRRGAVRRPPGVRRGRPQRCPYADLLQPRRGHRGGYVDGRRRHGRPGRALGAQQHRLGGRRARGVLRRRRAGPGQLALRRPRGRRRRRAHRRRAGRGPRRVPRARPGARAAPTPASPDQVVDAPASLVARTAASRQRRSHQRSAPDDVADILFTSGTTGRSKGAMSAHRQTIGVARAWAELGGVRQDDRYLVVNPFFHSFGYKIGIVVGLLTGCTLYPVATFDVDETMRLIESERITVLPRRADALPVAAQRARPRRARPVLAAARGHRRGRRTRGADREDARRAGASTRSSPRSA